MMNPTRHEDTSPSNANDYLREERPKRYSSIDLKSFTSDFSECIGYGGFAKVYKGRFSCGELIAVKLLNKSDFVENTFKAEVRTMGKTAHRNLVKFYGYCFENNMKALVYEYMEKGSLDKILYDSHCGNIGWVKLYAIVIDIANGLHYLHHELEEHIIHHDIKAANILLDRNLSAKIADFGLARIMDKDVSHVDLSENVRGTWGYNAPETFMRGSKVTSKCDVFSFGMMLFEVVGKRNNGKAENWFPGLVWSQFENRNLDHFLKADCSIAEKDKENANILCKIALCCVQENPDLRPSMKDVVLMVEKVKLVEDPLFPPFGFERERSDKIERDRTYLQNITAGPTNESVAESDRGVLPQQKSNKRKTRSPNMLERSDKMEHNPTCPQNIIAGPSHASIADCSTKNPTLAVAQELPETTPIVGLDSTFDRAWNFLGDNNVRIMGLYGMGGVGKTTLLKRINNELSKRGTTFDIVIWVVISKEVNMTRVQEEIGKKLGLSLLDSDSIFNVLKTMKFMLLLDDIWQRIDLQSIGVPSPSFENKSKIVFTTRSEAVCGHMDADTIIRVECLNWDAAWTLFKEKVGNRALSSDSAIPKLAEVVAKECLGLPLALITIGRSMAIKKTRHEWEHAISVLKKSAAEFPGMGDNVLPLLKFSYDSLPDDSVRSCFLFCSLYPDDYEIRIPELIEKWLGEEYINGYDNFKEAFNKGHDIIGILNGTCLLEEGEDYGLGKDYRCVKMHDVIRDLALWIACECGKAKNKYFVKAGVGLSEAPQAEKWPTMAEKISFIGNKITKLKPMSECPNLSTLVVSDNRELRHIDNDFFLSMPALRFLDLSWTAITKVPLSICDLVELEFLDLSNTYIESLPSQMRNLKKLKYLFLSYNNTGCLIPRGMIRSLWNLEFLKLKVIKSVDSEGSFEMDELLCLKKLKSIEIVICSHSKDVDKFLSYPQIVDCTRKLFIETCKDITSLSLSSHLKGLEYFCIWNCSEIKELKLNCIDKKFGGLYESLEEMFLDSVPKLICSWDARNLYSGAHFKKLHSLHLSWCDAMVDLTWLLLIPNLQKLVIHYCGSLQEIISSSADESGGASDTNIFSNLKTLDLNYLPNLQSICSMTALPFPSLEYIKVERMCPKLKRLPLDSNSASNTLKEIRGEKEWWDRLEWRDNETKLHFTKFYREM